MKPGNLWETARCQIRRQCSKDEGKISLRSAGGALFCCRFSRPAEKRKEMTMSHRVFTSESVTEGHPDKVCDH